MYKCDYIVNTWNKYVRIYNQMMCVRSSNGLDTSRIIVSNAEWSPKDLLLVSWKCTTQEYLLIQYINCQKYRWLNLTRGTGIRPLRRHLIMYYVMWNQPVFFSITPCTPRTLAVAHLFLRIFKYSVVFWLIWYIHILKANVLWIIYIFQTISSRKYVCETQPLFVLNLQPFMILFNCRVIIWRYPSQY